MARIEIDPNYNSPTFSRATAAADIFKKEDVQALAAAMSTHVHDGTGKGLAIAASGIPTSSITSAMIVDGTIAAADLAANSITTAKIVDANVTNAKLGSDTARLNLLVNGGFEVWQRGNGPFAATGNFAADRWQMSFGGGTMSVTRDTANVATPDSAACAAVVVTSPSNVLLTQTLEGTHLRGRTVTFSMRVKTSTASAVRINVFDGVATQASAFHSGGGAYETLTVTATLGAAVTGTNILQVSFAVACTAYLDNAMLVVGSQAADYAPLHPADDLARCLRYYETVTLASNAYVCLAFAFGTTSAMAMYPILVQKAVAPTVTLSAAATWAVTSAAFGILPCTAITATVQGGGRSIALSLTVASGLVAGNAGIVLANTGQTATLAIEANP